MFDRSGNQSDALFVCIDPLTENPMSTKRLIVLPCLLFILIAMACLPTAVAGEEQEKEDVPPTRVQVTVEIPSELPSFDDTALVAILFEFDPRIADKPADEVDRVVVRHLGHQQGIEQTLRFAIGGKLNNVQAERRYYVSCRIYEDPGEKQFQQGKQVHYCHNEHPQAPGRIYDDKNGKALTFTAR